MLTLTTSLVFLITIINLEAKGTPCEVNGQKGLCVNQEVCRSSGLIDINGSRGENCTTHQQFLPQRDGCGWSNPEGVGGRLEDDNSVLKSGEHPWLTAVFRLKPGRNSNLRTLYAGSGSLIHPRMVLTAAHVAKGDSHRVRVGEWDTQTQGEAYPYQEREVEDVKIHEQYNSKTLFNDIALLFLSSPVDLAPNVGVVCLPREPAAPGASCITAGWGKGSFANEGIYKVVPKKLQVSVVDHTTCVEQLRTTRLRKPFQLHSTFMCARGGHCDGDGGAPLVCPIESQPDRYIQHGIVSWGIGCGANVIPGVYVDVAVLRGWVDAAVAGRGFEIEGYSQY